MRLIDADATKINLDELHETSDPRINAMNRLIALCVEHTLRDAQTVDAEPVRHGHWIMTAPEYYHMMIHERCIPYTAVEYFVEPDDTACSVCAEKYNTNDFGCLFDVFPEYCPNCGAKMDEEENE